MRATIRTLLVVFSIAFVSGCVTGSHCLHRPCDDECAASFRSPSPFAPTVKASRPSLVDRVRRKLWDRDETPRDVTVRPETTPIPGARAARRPQADGPLALPGVVEDDCGE